MTDAPLNLSEILVGADAVLFDFDGPLCDVFSGTPAHLVARRLERLLGEQFPTDDPLEILRQTARFGDLATETVEKELIAAELEAVGNSTPNLWGLKAIRACLLVDKAVAIVSNNSAQAVNFFLERAGLLAEIHLVAGRPYAKPELMKPHPYLIQQALVGLSVSPNSAVFIGDSMTDIEVGLLVGTGMVAYANKPQKRHMFTMDHVSVIDDMQEVAEALHASST